MAKKNNNENRNENTPVSVTLKSIEKEHGPILKWLGEAASQTKETISTGSMGLDIALGKGNGFERGLIAEFFGPPGAGKSFLAYSVMRQACAKGYKCAIADAEMSLDANLLLQVGLPPDQVLLIQGLPNGESYLSAVDAIMRTGEFPVILVDSAAALIPAVRDDTEYGTGPMGAHAKMMSMGLQQLVPVVGRTNTLLIFVNQIRNKITAYGNPEDTTGGEALKFYSSYRIKVSGTPGQKSAQLVDGVTGNIYGHHTTFTVVKNKRGVPYRTAEVDLLYEQGYDYTGELIDLGVSVGMIDRSGAWISYKDQKWQGRDKARASLVQNPDLADQIKADLKMWLSGNLSYTELVNTEEEVDASESSS